MIAALNCIDPVKSAAAAAFRAPTARIFDQRLELREAGDRHRLCRLLYLWPWITRQALL
jgi:hypothetical protein